jgi:hypothetical protein
MTSDRKKPTAGFWITVALATVLVGYPLSFGPACWLVSRAAWLQPAFEKAFWPLVWLANRSPKSWEILRPYAIFGMPDSGFIRLPKCDDDVFYYIDNDELFVPGMVRR